MTLTEWGSLSNLALASAATGVELGGGRRPLAALGGLGPGRPGAAASARPGRAPRALRWPCGLSGRAAAPGGVSGRGLGGPVVPDVSCTRAASRS